MLAQWALMGAALWAAARSLTALSPRWIPLFVSSFALAGTLGFLALFAPAGLGVQEGILLVVLAPALTGEVVAVTVVAMRLIQTIADAVLAGVGLGVWRSLPGGEPTSK